MSATLASVLCACGPPAPEVGHLATIGRATLERPIALVDDAGTVHQPVAAANGEALAYYEQGLAFLASFDWVRAARSFHESLRRDPALAAAHLGLARTYLGLESPAEAQEHASEAARLAEAAGLDGWEAEWIALGTLQMRAVAARGRAAPRELRAYREAIESYVERHPGDVEGLLLRGNADPSPEGWGQVGGEDSLPWYEKALVLAPDFFPAHHFLAHSYENVGRYPEAYEQAKRYAELAPGVPHAHHMVAHTAPRVGRWDVALAELAEADRLHRASFAAGEIAPEEDWHYGHNLRLWAAAELHEGDAEKAEELYRRTFELAYGGRRAGFYCVPWIELLLFKERYDEALSASAACEARDSDLARVVGAALGGEALLGLGRLDDARKALERATAAERRFRSRPRRTATETSFLLASAVAVQSLAGKVALRSGKEEEAEKRLLGIAELFSSNASFDAWALGALRLEEIACDARRAGHPGLADKVAAHLARIEGES